MADIEEARRALMERDGALEREAYEARHDMIVLEKRRQMIEARRGEVAFALDLLGPGDDPDFAEVPVAEPAPSYREVHGILRDAQAAPAPFSTGLKESFEQLQPNIAARVLAETQTRAAAQVPNTIMGHRKPRRDVRGEVRAYIEANPPATIATLMQALGITAQSAQSAVQDGIKKGTLVRHGDHCWPVGAIPAAVADTGALGQSPRDPEQPVPASETTPSAVGGTTSSRANGNPPPEPPHGPREGRPERRGGRDWGGTGVIPARRRDDKERLADQFHEAQAGALKQRLQKAGDEGILEEAAMVDDQVIADGIEAGWLDRTVDSDDEVRLRLVEQERPQLEF